MTIIDILSKEWSKSGINHGDVVLIHSSIKRTILKYKSLGHDINPSIVLDSFIKSVGQEGTLLFPLFNFDFTKGIMFNIKSTVSKMGVLSEAARLYENSIRTGHPIYSFAVIGKKSKEFENIDNISGYGEDSPFSKLLELNGKIAVLDLDDQNSMTFYHFIEEMHQAPYRHYKTFKGEYIDIRGSKTIKEYKLYVRNLEEKVLTYVNPTGELLWENNHYKGFRPNEGNGMRTIESKTLYDYVSKIINADLAKGLLYRIDKGELI